MKKNKKRTSELLDAFINFLIERKVLLVCIIAIIYFVFLFACYYYRDYLGATLTTLEKINYCSQCIVGFFTVIGVCMAVLQYIYNSKANQKEKNREKISEAVRIAEKFSNEIIPEIEKVSAMYCTPEAGNLLKKIQNATPTKFDADELEKIFGIPAPAIVEYWYKLSYTSYCSEYSDPQPSIDDMKKIIVHLANQIEAFCICINSGIADENTLYQSLHSIFFSTIERLYIYISKNNKNEYDRLYYNSKKLYLSWRSNHKEIKELECNVRKEIEKKNENIMKNFIVENIDE